MRLLHTATLSLETFIGQDTPQYAILSHTWEDEEVTFDLIAKPEAKALKGYDKIASACQKARNDRLDYIWIDTCCIDKSSSAELSEAINSMFTWYKNAKICYAYLSDVDSAPDVQVLGKLAAADPRYRAFPGPVLSDPHALIDLWSSVDHRDDQFANSRWFTRGWTLQELLAPRDIAFFSRSWNFLTTKRRAYHVLSAITGIHNRYLMHRATMKSASIAERMSWASIRQTTRTEDMAYCLLGIFDINMPLLYGEGKKAFIRLQEEIMKQTDDHTLFAWKKPNAMDWLSCGLLADAPACFRDSRFFVPCENPEHQGTHKMTNRGLKIRMSLDRTQTDGLIAGTLNCTSGPAFRGLATIYLQQQSPDLPYFTRVKCSQISLEEPKRSPQELIYVTQSEPPSKIWLESYFVLRSLNGSKCQDFTLKNVMVTKAFEGHGQAAHTTQLASLDREDARLDKCLSQTRVDETYAEARKWVPRQFPLVYECRQQTGLVSVALEFRHVQGSTIIILLGSSTLSGESFDVIFRTSEQATDLSHCGQLFSPRPPLAISNRLSTVGVYLQKHIEDNKRITFVDIKFR